jgi:hypothetical protein
MDEIKRQFKYYSLDDITLFREAMGDAIAADGTGASTEDDMPF